MAASKDGMVPVDFRWKHAATSVSVTGDFADWGSGYPMTRAQDGFGVTLRFKPGARLVYKLIVDGVWTLDPDSPTETDSAGNRNHVLIVPDYVPPRASRPPLALGGLRGSAAEASEGSGGGTPRALGYIGAGVHREYSDEYGIDVSGNFGKGSSSMARSVSFADVGSLVHLVQAWGGGKSVAAGVAGADKGLSAGLAGGLGAARAKLSAAAALPPTPGPSEAAALPAFEVGASAALAALSAPAAASVAVASVSGAGDAGSAVAQSGAPTAMLRSVASVSKLASVAAPAGAAAPAAPLSTVVQASLRREGKLVLSMVGLPARGKTFIARRLKRHLTWMGYKTEIFNVGNYRRQHHGALQPADFFDPTNAAGEVARREVAMLACEEMCASLASDAIDIAIFDATNTTTERRRWLKQVLLEQEAAMKIRFQLVFIESVCGDEGVINSNIREVKLQSPDYKGIEEEVAVRDFVRRIQFYASIYQPLSDTEDCAYIKLVDVGRQIIANRIQGYLNSRVLFFLSNLHITPRPIYLSRHGESEYNVMGLIGGDSQLSPRGQAYSQRLGALMKQLHPEGSELVVWTSSLKRTQLTAASIGRPIVAWKALDEIDAGICDGMTYEDIAAKMPEEYQARSKNKFTYRYPRGESYQDIVSRLEPVLVELMRQKDPVLIVSHQATLRVVVSYLRDMEPRLCPDVLIPLHTVMQMVPKAYGSEELHYTNAQAPPQPPVVTGVDAQAAAHGRH